MIKFYTPTFASVRDDSYARVVNRLVGSFDVLTFMRGRAYYGSIPSDVRVILGDGDLGDFISTHVSWKIFSHRAAEMIARRAGDAVQFFDLPLYRAATGEKIDGYQILNSTCAIRCIDLSSAEIVYREDLPDEIFVVHKWVFDERAIPKNIHVFRAAEYISALYFSEQLKNELTTVEPPFKDLGFLEYGG
jgi:hypothetical protein